MRNAFATMANRLKTGTTFTLSYMMRLIFMSNIYDTTDQHHDHFQCNFKARSQRTNMERIYDSQKWLFQCQHPNLLFTKQIPGQFHPLSICAPVFWRCLLIVLPSCTINSRRWNVLATEPVSVQNVIRIIVIKIKIKIFYQNNGKIVLCYCICGKDEWNQTYTMNCATAKKYSLSHFGR